MSNDTYPVDSDSAGQTVAAFLRAQNAGMSWSDARKHLSARRVLVNGVLCMDDARRLKAGDRVELMGQSAKPVPKAQNVEVLYDDADIVLIDKPAGMESERRAEQRGWSEQKKLQQPTVFESLLQQGFRVFPVHRLDRDTSGLMVYALNKEAQEKLIQTFAAHDIERSYLAVAVGVVPSGTIHSWIRRDRGDGLRGSVSAPEPGAEEAITHVTVLEPIAGGKYTMVQCRLETGRTHQIRIHLAESGHPVCGEKLYVKPRPGAEVVLDESKAPRHALHCQRLAFAHPVTGRPMGHTLPWPADLERWLTRIALP